MHTKWKVIIIYICLSEEYNGRVERRKANVADIIINLNNRWSIFDDACSAIAKPTQYAYIQYKKEPAQHSHVARAPTSFTNIRQDHTRLSYFENEKGKIQSVIIIIYFDVMYIQHSRLAVVVFVVVCALYNVYGIPICACACTKHLLLYH